MTAGVRTDDEDVRALPPGLSGSDVRIVRHQFGGGAAVVVAAFAVILLAALTFSLGQFLSQEQPAVKTEPSTALPAEAPVLKLGGDVADTADASAPVDPAVVEAERQASENEKKEAESRAVDAAFHAVAAADLGSVRYFLSLYEQHPLAIERGYVKKAVAMEEALTAEIDAEEEKLKEEQRKIPWEMQ